MNDNNEPAFPCDSFQEKGMTLRDWFAGQWLIGTSFDANVDWSELTRPTIAKMAYEVADAMLEARKQKKDEVV
jgi:hypothetical protein